MPRIKQVHSLYFQCLNYIFEQLKKNLEDGMDDEEIERVRKYYVSNLHGGIREHILKLSVLKNNDDISNQLQLINILIDSTVSFLYPVPNDDLSIYQYTTLVQHLEKRECTGLKSLCMKMSLNKPRVSTKLALFKANVSFHSILTRGLAKNLTVLILQACCDNKTLKLLGQNCIHLAKLDVRNSWFVDDNGFRNLCLKEPELIEEIREGDHHSAVLLQDLMNLKDEYLNPCCFSLVDIRIQDTNTSDITVLMLLIFIKQLKTLGGFIYFRSVGDNIVFLSRLSKGALQLKLTELWDTHLIDSKLQHLTAVLPDLNSVYTRCQHLVTLTTRFQKVTDITIDFDFNPYEELLYDFLASNGKLLKRITLIDQNGFMALSRIVEFCPYLIELKASICSDNGIHKVKIPSLMKARVKIVETEMIEYILMVAPCLEYLEVQLCYPPNYHLYIPPMVEFNEQFLKELTKSRPKSFDTLKYFIINAPDSKPSFKLDTIWKFISQFKQLELIGDMITWEVRHRVVDKLRTLLKIKNVDLIVVFDREFEPSLSMQSIREFKDLKYSTKL